MAQEHFLDPVMPDILEQWRFYIGLLDLKQGDYILDIGCNTGDAERFILNLYPYIKGVIGLDKNREAIKKAIEGLGGNNQSKIRFVEGDALNLPFEDATFDKVLCIETLEWVKPPIDAIREFYRVLKPGGIALIEHTDFDTQVFATSNIERTREIVHKFSDSGPDGIIGRKLLGMCKKCGFNSVKPIVYTLINDSFTKELYSYKVAVMMKEWLMHKGLITQEQLGSWISDMEDISARGEFFYSVNRIICVCQK